MPLCFHEQRGIPFYSLPEKEGLLFLHRIINRFLYPFTNVQLIQFTVGRVRINPVTQKDIDQLIHRVHSSLSSNQSYPVCRIPNRAGLSLKLL